MQKLGLTELPCIGPLLLTHMLGFPLCGQWASQSSFNTRACACLPAGLSPLEVRHIFGRKECVPASSSTGPAGLNWSVLHFFWCSLRTLAMHLGIAISRPK